MRKASRTTDSFPLLEAAAIEAEQIRILTAWLALTVRQRAEHLEAYKRAHELRRRWDAR